MHRIYLKSNLLLLSAIHLEYVSGHKEDSKELRSGVAQNGFLSHTHALFLPQMNNVWPF